MHDHLRSEYICSCYLRTSDPLVLVVLFVGFVVSQFSSPSMGISQVSLHLEQQDGFLQLRLWCPTSWQFQQTGPNFPVDVDAKDDFEEVCLTPRLFRLLDIVSSMEGELVLSDWWFLVGASGASMKGSCCGCTLSSNCSDCTCFGVWTSIVPKLILGGSRAGCTLLC